MFIGEDADELALKIRIGLVTILMVAGLAMIGAVLYTFRDVLFGGTESYDKSNIRIPQVHSASPEATSSKGRTYEGRKD